MSEFIEKLHEALLVAYIGDVGCELSNADCNELSKYLQSAKAKDAEIAQLKEDVRYYKAGDVFPLYKKLELDDEIARLKEDKASLEKSILDQSHALVDENTRLRDELDRHKWIPVEEKLPDTIGWVIVQDVCNDVYPGYYDKMWYDDDCSPCQFRIIKWQKLPLPEPPKEDENG